MSEENRPRRRHRPTLVWPLVLIVIGVVFLLSNLGLIAGDVWPNLLSLWPLLLIAIGVEGLFRGEGIAGATLMLGLGIVFLLDNFGFLALSVWSVIFRLWPLLLVAIGFDVLVGRRSLWASLAGAVLILVLLVAGLWYVGVRPGGGQLVEGVQISQGLEGAEQATVIVEPGAGSLYMDAMQEPAGLLEGTVGERRGANVRQNFEVQDGRAVYTLEARGNFVGPNIGVGEYGWDLALNPEIPIDLQVELGAGDMVLDLRDLQISSLTVNLGVGAATITLPQTGRLEADIEGAVGQTTILVPEGVGLRMTSDTALAARSVPDDYEQAGDVYTSPGYEQAENRIDLAISQAIGNLVIREE